MKIPSCSLPVWKNLYDAALAFRDIEPWEWMSDSDVFGVQNPEDGEIGYCCVLGELGEVSAWSSTLEPRVLNNTETFNRETPCRLSGVHLSPTLSHGLVRRSKRDSTRPISKLSNSSASSFMAAMRGRNFALSSRVIIPWHLTESEARYLTLCLEQTRDVALCLEKDPDWLSAPSKNHYLVRVPVDEPSQSGKAHENSAAAQPAVSNSSMGQQTTFQAV